MSETKFKIGDKVYCPTYCTKIHKVVDRMDRFIFLSKNIEEDLFVNGLGFNDMPLICHATQENYELLSKLYPNVAFESPPKRKEPREIIEAMLDSGWYIIPIFHNYSDIKYVSECDLDDEEFNWDFIEPFDPKTGKTIIDFVDGEVVLESENVKL